MIRSAVRVDTSGSVSSRRRFRLWVPPLLLLTLVVSALALVSVSQLAGAGLRGQRKGPSEAPGGQRSAAVKRSAVVKLEPLLTRNVVAVETNALLLALDAAHRRVKGVQRMAEMTDQRIDAILDSGGNSRSFGESSRNFRGKTGRLDGKTASSGSFDGNSVNFEEKAVNSGNLDGKAGNFEGKAENSGNLDGKTGSFGGKAVNSGNLDGKDGHFEANAENSGNLDGKTGSFEGKAENSGNLDGKTGRFGGKAENSGNLDGKTGSFGGKAENSGNFDGKDGRFGGKAENSGNLDGKAGSFGGKAENSGNLDGKAENSVNFDGKAGHFEGKAVNSGNLDGKAGNFEGLKAENSGNFDGKTASLDDGNVDGKAGRSVGKAGNPGSLGENSRNSGGNAGNFEGKPDNGDGKTGSFRVKTQSSWNFRGKTGTSGNFDGKTENFDEKARNSGEEEEEEDAEEEAGNFEGNSRNSVDGKDKKATNSGEKVRNLEGKSRNSADYKAGNLDENWPEEVDNRSLTSNWTMSSQCGRVQMLPLLPYCNQVPPHLVGPLFPENHVHDEEGAALAAVEGANADVCLGGWWRPLRCAARHRVAVIVPYRDRQEHLSTLLSHLHPILRRQQLDYRIYVAEQSANGTFNKGILMNAAFLLSLKEANFHCYVFHDVDLIPEDDRNMYSCPRYPRHMSVAVNEFKYKLPYTMLVGGVFSIRTDHFLRVNGYSNLYWGWGGEDDDMSARILNSGLTIIRPSSAIARYRMIKHVKRKPLVWKIRGKLLGTAKRRMRFDGLNTLKFKLISTSVSRLYTNFTIDVGRNPFPSDVL